MKILVDNTTDFLNEAGYSGYSMSNNAVSAYESGEMPLNKWTKQAIIDEVRDIDASKVDLVKQLPLTILKDNLLYCSSWHHTSMYYNKTDFYSIDEIEVERLTQDKVDKWLSQQESKRVKQAPDIKRGDLHYLIWSGARNHPKATEEVLKDVNIETKGQFYIARDDKGNELLRKKIGSNGTRVYFKESLNESISKVEDTYITYSVNDVLSFLEDKDKPYRIVYDSREQMYLLGDAWDTIHHELIFTANNNGYYKEQQKFIDDLGDIDNYIDYGQGGQFIENGNGEDEEVDQYLFYIVYNPKGNNDLDFEVDGYDEVYEGVRGDLLTRQSRLEDTPLYSAWVKYNKQLESGLNEDIWDKSGQVYQPLRDSKYLKLQKKPINTLSLDEIKYLYAINRAGSSFIRYDSIEQAIEKEIDSDRENSWDSDIFEMCYEYLHSLNFPLTIYRAIRTDEINKDGSFNISGINNSRSWSTNINIYKDKSSSFRNLSNIVSAKIDSNIVDNSATIVNFYFYTGGRNVRKQNYGEYEISLKKNFKQTDLHDLQFVDKDAIMESLLDNAKDYFGTTFYKKLAGYLNTDGTYLDFSGEKLGNVGSTTRVMDHRQIADVIDTAEDGTDAMYQYMSEGNIRLMPEAPGINLTKEPTSEQYEKLKDYIYYFLGRDKEFYVDISDTNGGIVKSFEYESPTSVDLILLDIKDWFKDN